MLFYTHSCGRLAPFRTDVIAANVGEPPHVIDGLLNHESELVIREHATDSAGAVDHVFGPCHLLGFRFAPRIRDLNERRLYSMAALDAWPTLRLLVAEPINIRAIKEHWDEVLRFAASIRAGTVRVTSFKGAVACATTQPVCGPSARHKQKTDDLIRELVMSGCATTVRFSFLDRTI